MDRHAPHQDSASPWNLGMSGTDSMSTHFADFVHRYTWTETFTASVGGGGNSAVGTVLTRGFICPLESIFSDPPTHATPYVDMCLNDWIASMHMFWTGGLKYRITMIGTALHKISLIVSAYYGDYKLLAVGTSYGPSILTAQFSYVLDFDGSKAQNVYEFTIPWHGSTTDVKRVPYVGCYNPSVPGPMQSTDIAQCALGSFSIAIQSRLVATADVPQNVTFELEQCGASDVNYFEPGFAGAQYTFGTGGPPAMNGKAQVGDSIIVGPTGLPTASELNPIITEWNTNFCDMIRRPQLIASYDILPTKNITTGKVQIGRSQRILSMKFDNRNTQGHLNDLTLCADGVTPAVAYYQTTTNGMTMSPLIQQLANYYRFYRGSLRFIVELGRKSENVLALAGSVIDNQRDASNFEIESRPYYNYLFGTSLDVDPSRAMYNLIAVGKSRQAYASPVTVGAWGRSTFGTRTKFGPDQDIAALEIPYYRTTAMAVCGSFSGISPLAQPPGATVSGSVAPYGFATELFIRYTEDIIGVDTNDVTEFLGQQLRIYIMAGDDFNYSHFVTVPPVALNWFNNGAGSTLLYPSAASVPFAKHGEPAVIPSRKTKKKVVLELSDSDSDDSIVKINGHAQIGLKGKLQGKTTHLYFNDTEAKLTYNNIMCVPGSLAHFMAWLLLEQLDSDPSKNCVEQIVHLFSLSQFKPGYRNDAFVKPNGEYHVEYSLTLGGKCFTTSVDGGSLHVPRGIPYETLLGLCMMCLEWAIVDANSNQSPRERIQSYLKQNEDRNKDKQPLSIMNEIQAVMAPFVTLQITDLEPEGPANAYKWPIRVSLIADKFTYTATRCVDNKHNSKRAAAQACFQLLSQDIPDQENPEMGSVPKN